MYKLLKPIKDASIYSIDRNRNTGLDQILEVGSFFDNDNKSIVRSLIQFDFSEYSTIPIEEATLVMRESEVKEIPLRYTIYGYNISGSWDMGVGRKFENSSITNGVTWLFRNDETQWVTSNFDAGISGSTSGGGNWYTTPFSSQSFEYESADIQMDVLPLISEYVSGNVVNDGFIIKFEDEDEESNKSFGLLQFFSKETHTIYDPFIRIGIDTFSYDTGSLKEVDASKARVGIRTIPSFKEGNVYRIDVDVRDKYPTRSFDDIFTPTENLILPTDSFYRVIDYLTKDEILPYSSFTQLNCNPSGNFIQIDTSNFNVGRAYEIIIKSEKEGIVTFFKDKYIFTIDN